MLNTSRPSPVSAAGSHAMARQGSKAVLARDDSKASLAPADTADVASLDSVSVSGSEIGTLSPKEPPSSTESLVASTAAILTVREENEQVRFAFS
jgi:hypothetical protein